MSQLTQTRVHGKRRFAAPACQEYELHWRTLDEILKHTEPPPYRQTKPRTFETISAKISVGKRSLRSFYNSQNDRIRFLPPRVLSLPQSEPTSTDEPPEYFRSRYLLSDWFQGNGHEFAEIAPSPCLLPPVAGVDSTFTKFSEGGRRTSGG